MAPAVRRPPPSAPRPARATLGPSPRHWRATRPEALASDFRRTPPEATWPDGLAHSDRWAVSALAPVADSPELALRLAVASLPPLEVTAEEPVRVERRRPAPARRMEDVCWAACSSRPLVSHRLAAAAAHILRSSWPDPASESSPQRLWPPLLAIGNSLLGVDDRLGGHGPPAVTGVVWPCGRSALPPPRGGGSVRRGGTPLG